MPQTEAGGPAKPPKKPSKPAATDTSVGGNQGTVTTKQLEQQARARTVSSVIDSKRQTVQEAGTGGGAHVGPAVHHYDPGADLQHLAPPIVFQDTTQRIDLTTTDPAFLNTLNERAGALDAAFVNAYPAEAAALLTSAVPTRELPALSRRYSDLVGYAGQRLSLEGVPHFLVPYYAKAFNAPTPMARALALAFLDQVSDQPNHEMFGYLQSHMSEFDNLVTEHTIGKVAVAVAGGIAAAPIIGAAKGVEGAVTAGGAGVDLGLTAVGLGRAGDWARERADEVGGFAQRAPTYLGQATRLIYGTALAAGDQMFGRSKYDAREAFMRYAWNPSFGDAQHLGPAARMFFDVTGLDPESHEGLAALIDLGGDTVGGLAMFRGAFAYKRLASEPASMGGWRTGIDWVEKTRAGKKLIDKVDEVVTIAQREGDGALSYLRDNVKSMPEALAQELLRVATKDERARIIASWADETPTPGQFAAKRHELKQVHKELRDANPRPLTFEEWSAERPSVTTTRQWLRERAHNPTPRKSADLYGPEAHRGGYEAVRESMARRGWDPDEPLGLVYDYKAETFTVYDGTHRLALADELGITEIPVNIIGNADLANTFKMLQREFPDQMVRTMTPALETELLARKVALEQRLNDMNARLETPLVEWPRVARAKPILMNAPTTSFQRVVSTLYRRVPKALDVRAFIRDMSPREQFVYNPAEFRTNPPGWMEHNARVLRNKWRILRVDEKTQRLLIDDLAKIDPNDLHAFKDWVDNAVRAENHAMSRPLLPGSKPRDLGLVKEAQEVARYSERSREDAMTTPYVDEGMTSEGVRVRETKNVLEDPGNDWPLPVLENDWMSTWNWADIETLRQASSHLRYADAWMKNKPYLGKVWGVTRLPYDVAKLAAFVIPRLVMKPLLFVGSAFGFRMAAKVQFDQGLRAGVMGMNPLKVWGRRNIDFLPDGTPIKPGIRGALDIKALLPENDLSLLGVLRDTGVMEGPPIRVARTTRHLDPNRHPKEINEALGGVYDGIMHFRNSELARTVASRGVEGTLRYLESNPESMLATYVRENMMRSVERAGTDLPTALTRLDDSIRAATSGRADLRAMIATGRLRRGPAKGSLTDADQTLAVRRTELDHIRAREDVARVAGDQMELTELARRYDEVADEVVRLERNAARQADGLDFGNKQAIIDALREEHANRGYTMPDEVYVTKRVGKSVEENMGEGILGGIHKQFATLSDWLYRGLRPVGAVDAMLTRGSVYYQLLERNTKQLVARGFTQEQAFRVAQYRSAFATRDLMYDLAARSSFDRATKDLFWFAPVLREQLTTWLFKIPNEAYWPVGFTALAGSAHNLIEDAKRLGWARDDEMPDGSKRLVVNIPLIGDLLGKFQGAPVEFGIDSLNPVTPAGSSMVPTLSPGGEALMQFATRKAPTWAQGFLKTISRRFTFDHGEMGTNWMPQGVNGMLQVLGINPPYKDQWNPTMWERAEKQAYTQAVQFAMSDLLAEGIEAPQPGAPKSEYEEYRVLVEARAADYEGGLNVMRFVSSWISPLSITAEAPAKARYEAWKKKQGIEFPYEEGDYALIDEYVAAHPEALPYTIGRFASKDDPTLPQDAPLADKMWAEDVVPIGEDMYWRKFWTTWGFAAEEQRLRGELRAAGVGTVENQLRNWNQYTRVYSEHLIRMDKWFQANPEVEEYLNRRSDLSARDETLLETSRNLRMLESMGVFEDVGSAEVGAVRAAILQATDDTVFGEANTPRERALTFYFDEVYGKYQDEVQPLYDLSGRLFASGQDGEAFKVLDRIRQVSNSYTDVEYEGMSLPSPEEFSFNNKDPKAQRVKKLDWTLSNPQHLTNFQLSVVGVPDFDGRDVLVAALSSIDDRIYGALADPGLSDAQRDALYATRIAERQRTAMRFGPGGIQFERLASMTPSDRLTAQGFGRRNFYWNVVTAEAQELVRHALAQGSNPKYAAETTGVFDRKVALHNRVNFFRAIDPEFDRLWRTLSRAAAPYGEDFKLGVPLYEHVFFGQTQNQYNYQDPLVAAVERTP
jgi:hypothetical protein